MTGGFVNRTAPRTCNRRAGLRLALTARVLAALLAAGCRGSQSVLAPAGPQAERVAHLWWLSLAIGTAVAVLVTGAVLLATRAARRREGTPSGGERRAIIGIVIATAVSVVLLLGWLLASLLAGRPLTRVAAGRSPGAAPPLTIEVVGRQWWWEVRYLDPRVARRVTTANEIRVPVGREVVLRLSSADVIHSFWAPNLNGKRDLVPGYTTTTWFRADTPGVFRGQCAEFCGLQHAKMAFMIVAQPPAQFAAWYAGQLRPAAPPGDSLAARGQQVFLGSSCALCHAIQGTPASATTGPDLTHLASRLTIAAGTLPNTRGHRAGWILDPQGVKPGVLMPATPLSANDLRALLRYLETLQ